MNANPRGPLDRADDDRTALGRCRRTEGTVAVATAVSNRVDALDARDGRFLRATSASISVAPPSARVRSKTNLNEAGEGQGLYVLLAAGVEPDVLAARPRQGARAKQRVVDQHGEGSCTLEAGKMADIVSLEGNPSVGRR